jgi:cyanophycinase
MSSTHLIGGGWSADICSALYGPFLDAAGPTPTVACVVLDEGDGAAQFRRWATVLEQIATCQPVPLLVPLGQTFAPSTLADADGLLVCGGLTPAYADALAPVAGEIREWLAAGDRPYAGFSAGASIVGRSAVVGGWRSAGRPICPEDAGEDLDEVTVVEGLALPGLLDVLVDVHCAQWGTLPRLIDAVERSTGATGLGIDENTALQIVGGVASVVGAGVVRRVVLEDTVVQVRTYRSGDVVPLP